MSELTVALMGLKRPRVRGEWPARLLVATNRLVAVYGTPTLGNFRNPVKEIFYILLSARTTEQLYQTAHSRLFRQFPTVVALASAKPAAVEQCVGIAGFGAKRARQIIRIARRLLRDLGSRPGARLSRFNPAEAFTYLTSLPGVGPKSALCVMMCSLDHDVFPVDVNVQRVLERLGTIKRGLPHYRAQQIAPRFVPPGMSKQLHVALVEHGRKICVPRKPRCDSCMLLDMCRLGQKQSAQKVLKDSVV